MKKMIIFFVVLLFAISIVSAENNTNEDSEIEDNANYILPISITNNGIEFSDGFTGFSLDLSKNSVSTSDKFILGSFSNNKLENRAKLAIIECYKQGKEKEIRDIIGQIDSESSNNEVLKEVFSSNEKVGDKEVVKINNETEATFDFELLKSTDESGQDCIAYKVSLKTIETPNKLTASNDDQNKKIDQQNTSKNTSGEKNNKIDQPNTSKNTTGEKNNKKTATESKNANTTPENKTVKDIKTKGEPANKTTVTETNKTIVNKTNTVIINENNTTIINKNNVKTINKTNDTPENETPKNDTVSNMLKAGNPILVLIIVIVIAVIAVAVMRRKD